MFWFLLAWQRGKMAAIWGLLAGLLLGAQSARAVEGTAGEAQYLIVTTEALREGFEALAAFRASPEGGGLRTRILTLEDINRERTETRLEERIRGAIQSAYQTAGTQFVVLGGRAQEIPPVRVWTPVTGIANQWTAQQGTPSDWYYACLEGEPWPQTETGFCGYPSVAGLDLTAEVAVGRIPAVDVASVKRYVRRLQRYGCPTSPAALKEDHVLLNGLAMSATTIADWSKADSTRTDGYPWIGEVGHPAGASDSELWLRNIVLSRILPARPAATLDLCFPNACGDPETRTSFTSALSIDRPADFNRYLAQRPEFVAISSHGLPAGVGRLTPLASSQPGNAWGIVYTVGCNTAQFDERSLAHAGQDTGMALPDAGAFDGTWQCYALAEHTLLGGEESGGLVYIASTREGWRTDGIGGIGGKSYEYLAAFAERWAQGGKCLGECFQEHKLGFIERAKREGSYDERSLFVGTTYFGDPALSPLRDRPAAAIAPVQMTFVDGETAEARSGLCGMRLDEVAPAMARAGQVFVGWTHADGSAVAGSELVTSAWQGLRFVANWREATASEAAPVPLVDPALMREAFESGSATVAVKGYALAPTSKGSPIIRTFAAGGEPCWLTFHVRHESGFENDENRGVVAAIQGPAGTLSLQRRLDLGWTLDLEGTRVGAVAVPLATWHHVALKLTAEACELYLNGELKATLPSLGLGMMTVVFGGKSASEQYGWANAGTLFLDEALAFKADAGVEAEALFELHQLAADAVPVRRLLPATGELELPAGMPPQMALVLSGQGTLAPATGAALPTVLSPVFPAVHLPETGSIWTTPQNREAMGLGMLTWDSGADTPPQAGWVAVAKPELKVTHLAIGEDGALEVEAEVASPLPVAFTPQATFRLVNVTDDVAEVVPSAEHAGSTARLRLPAAEAKQRLFRIRVQ
ncbi:MAG: C25 family cysteine peptidase [Candidatus Spyradenecus sp.]